MLWAPHGAFRTTAASLPSSVSYNTNSSQPINGLPDKEIIEFPDSDLVLNIRYRYPLPADVFDDLMLQAYFEVGQAVMQGRTIVIGGKYQVKVRDWRFTVQQSREPPVSKLTYRDVLQTVNVLTKHFPRKSEGHHGEYWQCFIAALATDDGQTVRHKGDVILLSTLSPPPPLPASASQANDTAEIAKSIK